MSLNNSITINDCITNLQTVDDLNTDINRLKAFLEDSKLLVRDQKALQNIINLLTIKNTKQKTTIHKVANSLNKLGYY